MQEQLADAHAALQAAATAEARAERAGRDKEQVERGRETAGARADERTWLDEMQASRQEVVEATEAVRQADDTYWALGRWARLRRAGRISASAQLAEVQRRHEMRQVADATTPFLKAAWARRHVVRGHMAWTANAPARPPLLLSGPRRPRSARPVGRHGRASRERQAAVPAASRGRGGGARADAAGLGASFGPTGRSQGGERPVLSFVAPGTQVLSITYTTPCDHDSRGGFPNRLKSDSP